MHKADAKGGMEGHSLTIGNTHNPTPFPILECYNKLQKDNQTSFP